MTGGYLQDRLWIKQIPSYYSPAQVRQYLSVVGYQPILEEDEILSKKFPRSVETLDRLIRHHQVAFPFENTGMHYTASHAMDVSPQGAFDRLVVQGKGSYCFGLNSVLLGILRGLGFRAYSGAARVNRNWSKPEEVEAYDSHTHMVIFVQPYDDDNRTWVVDGGFGMLALARAIPLVSGNELIVAIEPTEVHRLRKAPLPGSSLAIHSDSVKAGGQDLWIMEVWKGTEAEIGKHLEQPWLRQYTFTEQEFFPADYADASFVVSQGTGGFFRDNVVAVKYIAGGEGAPYRVVLFRNVVKKYVRGKEEVVRTFDSEAGRLKALREVFGIHVEEDAIEHIKGHSAAL